MNVLLLSTFLILFNDVLACGSLQCETFVNKVEQSLNLNVSPCDDFYEFSCSGYNNNYQTKSSKGDPMTLIEQNINHHLIELLKKDKLVIEPEAVKMIKDFYAICVNTIERDNLGNGPLLEKLNEYGGWPILQTGFSGNQLNSDVLIGNLRRLGYSILIKLNVKIDERNLNRHIITLAVPTIEKIPDYNGNLMSYISAVAIYSTVLQNMVKLLGDPKINESILRQDIKDILKLQMDIQRIMAEKSADYNSTNTIIFRVGDMQSYLSSNFNLLNYLNAAFKDIKKFEVNDEIMVSDIGYLNRLSDVLNSHKQRTVQNYLLWQVVKDVAEDGNNQMRTIINQYRRTLSSTNETCLKETKGFMGYAILHLYINNNNAYEPLVEMVQNLIHYLKKGFSTLIDGNMWMNSNTKEKARQKLTSMGLKMGYPNWVMNKNDLDAFYKKILSMNEVHFKNIFLLSEFHSHQELQLINQPVDKLKWEISPMIANAFYHRSLNEIYIPITLLQEPLFHKDWPISAKFGAIGSVIGHEMSHGFDDKTFVHFPSSNLNNSDYNSAANCVRQQYDKYCLPQNRGSNAVCVNGEKTLIENIADIGGVKAAFQSFQLWKQEHSKDIPVNSRFTSDQLFFMAYSQLWCKKIDSRLNIDQYQSSSNSPNKYRLNGPLENINNFEHIFNCTNQQKITKCHIW